MQLNHWQFAIPGARSVLAGTANFGALRMYRAIILLAVFFSPLVSAQDHTLDHTHPEYIDPQKEMARLGWPIGMWEGTLEVLYNPYWLDQEKETVQKPDIRIRIREKSAEIHYKDDKGKYFSIPGEIYIYIRDNTVLVSHVYWNGGFVEYQSFALAQTDPDVIKGYHSRTVHNLVVPSTSDYRVMPSYALVELERTL